MSDIVITVDSLSKSYKIGLKERQGRTFREMATDVALSPIRRIKSLASGGSGSSPKEETFWALKDASFEVKRGEVVGIIGRNGAGKSTMLKILSRITEPTSGEVRLRGRVASLLEVGTGFHPELTGRENIYLNGAILGMKRAEITRKFDEIVAFAEVEKFLDTPVKFYSSGMYVRLAFAVAAHLEPEILIVDEVLAVGDAEFQKKCLGKMKEVSEGGGRTVLFVSHNMGAIQTICNRGIMLLGGSVVADGSCSDTVSYYLRNMMERVIPNIAERKDRRGAGHTQVCAIDISANGLGGLIRVTTGQTISFVFKVSKVLPNLSCRFTLLNDHGSQIVHFNSAITSDDDFVCSEHKGFYVCDVEEFALSPGRYFLNVAMMTGNEIQDHIECAAIIDVEAGNVRGRPVSLHAGYGAVCLPHRWRIGSTK